METTLVKPGLESRFSGWAAVGIVLGLFFGTHPSSGQTYEVVHRFRTSGQMVSDEIASQSRLILASDGLFYGTTYWGGSAGFGTVYRMDSAGNVTTMHSFAYADGAMPAAGLVQSSDGFFYGTTARGGSHDLGTVFRMDLAGFVTRLHSFDGADGQYPAAALILASDGSFYGVASGGGKHGAGTVFRIGGAGGFETLHSFDRYVDGANSVGELLEANGSLYGTTKNGGAGDLGTVFRLDFAGQLTTLHVFAGTDGKYPCAGLIRAASGNLYGTTSRGGATGAGTVFRLDASDVLTKILSFDQYTDGAIPRGPLVQALSGDFYGTLSGGSAAYENGTVFRLADPGKLEIVHAFDGTDGVHPIVSLVEAPDGSLYGLTSSHFSLPDFFDDIPGTVFRLDTAGFGTLHRFGWQDGVGLSTPLLAATDGSLYGTTAEGGSSNLGTLFRIDASGDVVTLHNFEGGLDGAGPGYLIQASDGKIYGADWGGENEMGRIFRLEPSGGTTTTLHSFEGTDGAGPNALTESSDGKFYGTTATDSYGGYGSLFRIDASGDFALLGVFNPDGNGAHPSGALVEGSGKFYGTTTDGGRYGTGCVFSAGTDGDIISEYSFDYAGSDGAYPMAGLTDVDGDFWGTTSGGGDSEAGTVFVFRPHDVLPRHFFNGEDGAYPLAAPVLSSPDGHFYGTTALGGAAGKGTIFSMDYDGHVTTLYAFPGRMDGGNPNTALVQASDGFWYGAAGVIYRLSDATVAVNQIMPTSGPASGKAALILIGGGFAGNVAVTVGGGPGNEVTALDSTFLYLFTPTLSPGTLNDVAVTVPAPSLGTAIAIRPGAFFADFVDVPQIDPFHDFVEKIFREGITAGCAAGSYCPDGAVTRAQMAVFLLKSEHGAAYVPPPCTGLFADVACASMFADWIEQLAAEGITAGCGGGDYCPASPVTRAQMAVFLLKAKYGAGYQPPECAGVFGDVACPGLFASWIEQLASEKITGGCGGGSYCPDDPNTRGQMSVFLVKTFGL